MQRLQIPKKTVKSSFLKFKVNVQRRTMAVYFVITLLPYQNQGRSPGNHHAVGITAHMDCNNSVPVSHKEPSKIILKKHPIILLYRVLL